MCQSLGRITVILYVLQAEEAEEDDLKNLFKSSKSRKKKNERSHEEIAMLVEQFMARLEVAAEEDAELNRQSKPAINKLETLPSLINILSK
jgi:transcription factor SPN1